MNIMSKYFLCLFVFPVSIFAQQAINFDKYFIDKTMRIDYYHTGDARTEIITLDHIYEYGIWAGSRKNLIDDFNLGRYYAKVYDIDSGDLIFSKGFDTYFGEYKTTDQALNGHKRTYHESILIPSPGTAVLFTLERRDSDNMLYRFYTDTIIPGDVDIRRYQYVDPSVEVYKILVNDNPHRMVDVVILAEGYTINEREKFKSDAEQMVAKIFTYEPYKSQASNFNFYAVFSPSVESGIDEPRAGIYKRTALSATFNALGSERYLLTEDNKTMRDLAAHVPYDAIYIMVNHKRYGGGGIYNLFCTFTADNAWTEYLYIHEFGHSFAGLADEYYSSSVAYNEFFPKGVEPLEPNITALLDANNIKWKDHLSIGIELPTKWPKKTYDQINEEWQILRKKLNQDVTDLKKKKVPLSEIAAAEKEYGMKHREAYVKMDQLLKKNDAWGKVGAFEGAGYVSTGLYRPTLDCIMFSVGFKPYCKVCEAAINKRIEFYKE